MDTAKLKKFAQAARRQLREQVAARLETVLKTDSAELREKEKALTELKSQISKTSKEAVIDRVAYIWFNRFCALRFMDVNRYTRTGTVSPAEGFSQPEILGEAKQGHIDDSLDRFLDKQKVLDLLAGTLPAKDPQNEAYRMLLVAVCNSYNAAMSFLFEKIADYPELLMPVDLLSESSILSAVREALTEDSCQDVEVIGWLYQFYISEKKDEVFEGLKKNQKITPENIPAATQLFTPHWIVRYLVENSLGRLWMLNRPNSKIAQVMDYYIKPEQEETDFLKVGSPEELKICDPACGSGHMLVYAFDLLYAIYEEEGYEPAEIPEKILTNNLFGIEIDERAGELAAFALTMKARSKHRRFLRKPVQPNICVLENVKFDETELKAYMDAVGRNLFTINLETTLRQFEEADNFGSLIRPAETDVASIKRQIKEKDIAGNLFLFMTHQKVMQVLRQAEYLSPKYHVVIANPPYLGGKGMNGRLGAWAKDNYPDTKSDLFAMFIERNLTLAHKKGSIAMITMQSWMFLASFEKLRASILNQDTILSMAHLGARAFDSIGGEVVQTTAFIMTNIHISGFKGNWVRLVLGNSEAEKNTKLREAIKNSNCGYFYKISANDFGKIPGCPITYWMKHRAYDVFEQFDSFGKIATVCQGLATTDNNRFVRNWSEISFSSIGFGLSNPIEAMESALKWFPFDKGGSFRKWFGNNDFVVNWQNDGEEIKTNIIRKYPYLKGNPDFVAKNPSRYFMAGVTWGKITTGRFSARYSPSGAIFSDAGMKAFVKSETNILSIAGFFNSKITPYFLSALSETINFEQGNVARLPHKNVGVDDVMQWLISTSKADWDSFENSWDFTELPLLSGNWAKVSEAYRNVHDHWWEMTLEMKRLEEENNRIFIEAYGLQDELTPEVPLKEITLTCNPHYRYGGDKTEEELEAQLQTDTMKEYISFAVGCMFGRYSLDKPGLILANQGETLEDYLRQIPEPTFTADDDNVIPMLDGDWFTDDISELFKKFLKVTFGEDHYAENLKFIEQSLGKDIRKYFLKDFYADHLKRYKKRPIYWLFSSPKGSFNALIYMHRYRSDTVSVVLNDYLREFRTKLTAHKSHLEQVSISGSASAGEKTKALKEIETLSKIIQELEEYERTVLYPLATQKIDIDLDDGVKVNYSMLGSALRKISGMNED